MEKIQLAENLFLYGLTGPSELNIPVFVNEGKVLLIDTGYPEQAQELKAALSANGLQPEVVVNSHYHPDHINGNSIFAGCKFMGHERYKQNFELYEALNPHINLIKPTTLLKNNQLYYYGDFELKFISLPGHSQDMMIIAINKDWLYITDLLMFSNDGKHSLPYVGFDGTIDEHLQSLDTLASLPFRTMIPSHGTLITTQDELTQAITLRKHYLTQLKARGKQARLEDCILGPIEQYCELHLHDANIKNQF